MNKLFVIPALLPIAYGLAILLEIIVDKLLSSKETDFKEWELVYNRPFCNKGWLVAGIWLCLGVGCYFPASLKGQILSCILLIQLLITCIIDYKYQFIFDEQNALLLLTGLARLWDYPSFWKEPALACVGAFVVMFVLAIISRGAMGGGDVKLMAALGVWLGLLGIGQTFFYGIIAGGVGALGMLLFSQKGRKDFFAFGPYLCIGAIYAWFLQCNKW